MTRLFLIRLAMLACPFALIACAESQPRPAGPTSDTSAMPWNTPVPGQGQGQFGMLPQNQHRR